MDNMASRQMSVQFKEYTLIIGISRINKEFPAASVQRWMPTHHKGFGGIPTPAGTQDLVVLEKHFHKVKQKKAEPKEGEAFSLEEPILAS